jgi:1-acyl-sn-glycerol-3-phosphate acyltransferase
MAKKRIDRFSIRYRLLKIYVIFTHRIFYRKMQIKFRERIPRNRPVLLAPNHQNALMDAMAPLLTSRRDPVFLARADVFKNKFIAGILRLLKILPVYRIRDGAGELAKNEAIFRESMEVLLRGKCPVCIMPEGNHGNKRKLRSIVKGIFRVALQAQESYGTQPGVVILPVGIDYSSYSNFRGNLLTQFGEPIEVSEYYPEYLENQPKAINAIRQRLAVEMRKYMIDIQSEEHYDTYMLLRKIYNRRMRERLGIRKSDLYHRLVADQQMIDRLATAEQENPDAFVKITRLGREYSEGVEGFRMRDWVFSRSRYSVILLAPAGLALVLMLPAFAYGFAVNYLIYRLIECIGEKPKDLQFHSSVKFVLGTFLFPLYYLILFIPVWIFTGPGWIKWAFLASLPLTGLFAHTWFIWFKKFRSLWKYQILTIRGDNKLLRLKELRNQIKDLAESLIPDT